MKARTEPVLVLHHAVTAAGKSSSAASDAGVMDEVRAVVSALAALGIPHRVEPVANLRALPAILTQAPERLVFNLVENFEGGAAADAMQVPAVCEAFGKACTGNDSPAQTLCLDKWRTKGVLQAAALPVPAGHLVVPGNSLNALALPPAPWIVKPLAADASEGIHTSSVVDGNVRDLHAVVDAIHREFRQPALVESFFGIRELNVAILQDGKRLRVLPVSEIEFRNYGKGKPRIVDYAAKWHPDSFEYRNTIRVVPAALTSGQTRRIQSAAVDAWHAVGCRDYARVDFRMDADGQAAILEVNPNPDISPESGFAASLKAAGIPFREFVRKLLCNAVSRHGDDLPCVTRHQKVKRRPGLIHHSIRRTKAGDRDPILDFLRATGFFHDGELLVAKEVLDEAIKGGAKGHYQSFSLLEDGFPVGWICYGPTPCTIGTYDVYWIGVAPNRQGKGYGRALLQFAEKRLKRLKARLIVIETSGRSTYDSTRGFYLGTGYREAARVTDFYAPGDPRVIYTKQLVFS